MEILRAGSVPTRQLGDEERATYDAAALRIVITRMPPHAQLEHRHDRLYEATYVLEGRIEVSERDGERPRDWVPLEPDDCVVFAPRSWHNTRNVSVAPARTLTVKFAAALDLDAQAFARLANGDWEGFVPG